MCLLPPRSSMTPTLRNDPCNRSLVVENPSPILSKSAFCSRTSFPMSIVRPFSRATWSDSSEILSLFCCSIILRLVSYAFIPPDSMLPLLLWKCPFPEFVEEGALFPAPRRWYIWSKCCVPSTPLLMVREGRRELDGSAFVFMKKILFTSVRRQSSCLVHRTLGWAPIILWLVSSLVTPNSLV